MKKSIKKMESILIILVIIGTIFANLSYISIKASINKTNNTKLETKDQLINNEYELDFKTTIELSNYLFSHAIFNHLQFTYVVFSAAILFETTDYLIVIGHGHLDSKNHFYIGDYSETIIKEYALDKKIVALLSCYSSMIELNNDVQLTYSHKIDLISAIDDLFSILQWMKNKEFTPTNNILLFDPVFDNGGGAGSTSNLDDAPIWINGLRYAHSYYDGHIYWNLKYDSAIRSLSNYMLYYKGRIVEFVFSGDFLMEHDENSGNFIKEYHTITFNGWVSVNSDTYNYVELREVKIDGNYHEKKKYTLKLEDLMLAIDEETYRSNVITALSAFAGVFGALAGVIAGVYFGFNSIANTAITAAGSTAATVMTSVGWTLATVQSIMSVAFILGVVIFVIAILVSLTVVILAACWR
ncbi:MAG: hypothetical protein FK730_15835 [Asgard group archaeon]|nr:hypothetical protein [Asgard group archaeon]